MGWGGVDLELSNSEEEGWLGVAINDIWRLLPKEPGRMHGWAKIPESVEVKVEVIEQVEDHSACRC
jgi:hypothetical protein